MKIYVAAGGGSGKWKDRMKLSLLPKLIDGKTSLGLSYFVLQNFHSQLCTCLMPYYLCQNWFALTPQLCDFTDNSILLEKVCWTMDHHHLPDLFLKGKAIYKVSTNKSNVIYISLQCKYLQYKLLWAMHARNLKGI